MKKKTILYLLLIFSLLGLAASVYLVNLHYANVDSFCDFNQQFSCSSINQSAYSKIFGIPISIIGSIGYFFFALIPLLSLLNFDFKRIHKFLNPVNMIKYYFVLALLGFLFSLYLTYLELHTINVICPLCLFSQIIIIMLTFFSYVLYKKMR
jgi:uncharacterized membrane protein